MTNGLGMMRASGYFWAWNGDLTGPHVLLTSGNHYCKTGSVALKPKENWNLFMDYNRDNKAIGVS
jgi:hypothetical protein